MRTAILALLPVLAAAPAQMPPWQWLATEHLGWLVPQSALQPVGLAGTDLGVSFPSGDRLVFLFGDSWTLDRQEWDHDSAAWLPAAPLPASGVPSPTFFTQPGGRFRTLAPAGMVQKGMDVPVEGLRIGDRTYVFFSSGFDKRRGRHSHSMLVHADDADLATLELDHRALSDRFVNVSIVREDEQLWIFGTGAYRQSPVFLARVPAAELANRSAWRYWPDFVADEAAARPLVASDCIGELSVRRMPGSGLWAMTCNAAMPRGIHLRVAASPVGPWSDPVVVFDPSRDRGYGHCMHQKVGAVGYDDGLSMPGREEEWGGEYGPYLVPEWCAEPAPGVLSLVYTLSTWNPYTVRLVRSHVSAPGVTWTPPAPAAVRARAKAKAPRNLAFAKGRTDGWKQEGDPFQLVARDDGSFQLLTHVAPRGDAVQGRLWQEFTVPIAARELRGIVSGGSEAVELWRGDELVRSTRGRRSNEVDVPFRWRLEELRGETVRLAIADASAGRWGFVAVRGLELVE